MLWSVPKANELGYTFSQMGPDERTGIIYIPALLKCTLLKFRRFWIPNNWPSFYFLIQRNKIREERIVMWGQSLRNFRKSTNSKPILFEYQPFMYAGKIREIINLLGPFMVQTKHMDSCWVHFECRDCPYVYAAVYHWTSNWRPKIRTLKKFLEKLNPYYWYCLGFYIAFEIIIFWK